MTYSPISQPSDPGSTIAPELEAARERTIRLLTDRYADDTLPVEEFERRLDRLYHARSPAELDALVRDVLVPSPRHATTRTVPVAPAPLGPSTRLAASSAPRRMTCVLGESAVSGPLALTPEVQVKAIFAAFIVDLRDADFPPEGIDLEITGGFSDVKVLVPPGVLVEGAPATILAAFHNEAAQRGHVDPGAPRVRLGGSVWFSEVKVRSAPPGPPTKTAWKLGRVR